MVLFTSGADAGASRGARHARIGALILVALLQACSNAGNSGTGGNNNGASSSSGNASSTDCTAGTPGCACAAMDRCLDMDQACVAGTCQPCTAGQSGCACGTDNACDSPGDTCATGRCRPAPCTVGAQGCPCTADNRCGINDRGQQLTCMDNTCAVASCPPGNTGCACTSAGACNTSGDTCREGFCRPGSCVPGELNCDCAGGACNGANLVCQNGTICVDNTGFPGGPCNPDNTCQAGARCQSGTCLPCVPGTLGCNCSASNGCFEGLACANGRCITDDAPRPPANPRCYTPCSDPLVTAEQFRACDAEGLMEGCVGNTICFEGSCIPPSGSPRTCESEVDCPDWQTCIRGQCYSNCDTDDQCATGEACYRHVCRQRCSTNTPDSCPPGRFCSSATGDDGFCMVTAPPTGEPQTSSRGAFEVVPEVVAFSNIQTTQVLRITNDSPAFERFKVRKFQHFLQRADATSEEVVDEDDATACVSGQNCPLFWLDMGITGSASRVQEFEVTLEPGETRDITVSNAGGVNAVRWQGALQVIHEKLGTRVIRMNFVERPEGQWAGNMYFFATFGDRDIGEWADPAHPEYLDSSERQLRVGNAFIQRWGAFRRGQISWDEFQAVLTATRSESWRFPAVQRACGNNPNIACYLYDGAGAAGVATYSTDLDSIPIPTGITELPIAFNLRLPSGNGPTDRLQGRIETSKALQYAGTPAVDFVFANDVQDCTRMQQGTCMTVLNQFNADIVVGGRFVPNPGQDCGAERTDGTYVPRSFPWLLPGFTRATTLDGSSGQRMRTECRDERLPFTSSDPMEADALKPLNVALSAANPVPDGRSRTRKLKLIDGALINQSLMFVLFEEQFPSFMDPTDTVGFKAYGYMVLERARVDLPAEDKNGNQVPDAFDGSNHADTRTNPTNILAPSCDPGLLTQVLPAGTPLSQAQADRVVRALLEGVIPNTSSTYVDGTSEVVHYLCRDTGLIDGGPEDRYDSGSPAALASVRVPCPAGSVVDFFTVKPSGVGGLTQAQIAALPCQQDGSCADVVFNRWNDGAPIIQRNVLWRCADGQSLFCDDNRNDLRAGKLFYAEADTSARFVPLGTQVDEAFRYKTRFRSRTGATVGFAPTICQQTTELAPYCYKPELIEESRARVDCLMHIWSQYYAGLPTETKSKLDTYLDTNFAYTQRVLPQGGLPETKDGFEKLYAELLIMLGDEAYTASFASRFDLAATRQVSFEGSAFETGGINLSGVAGFEMFSLYQAVQYYQEALDRFYEQSPLIWRSLGLGDGAQANFVSQATVTSWFDRLVRASTQKTRALSQIARKYQGFNRADLARAVVERAYTAAYMESVVMARLMIRVQEASLAEDRAQLRKAVEDSQRQYRVAMLEMRDVYEAITDRATLFGLTPDYVPLPALDQGQPNAFEVVVARALEKTRTAREREDLALSANRSYETDAQQFQAELARIRNTYENQLGDLCGTFIAGGRVYPAINKYAELDPRARALGEPCGLMGNGAIHATLASVDQARLDIIQVNQQTENVIEEINIENTRVSQQCGIIVDTADYVYEQAGVTNSLKTAIAGSRNAITLLDRTLSQASTLANLSKCSIVIGTSSGGDCPAAGVSIGVFMGVTTAINLAAVGLEIGITAMEASINEIDRNTARYQALSMCELAKVDSNARQATLLLRLKELDLDRLRAHRRLALAVSEVMEKYNLATRIQLEQQDTEQLTINVEAARNDPNVRIYKNDAVINADISFQDAAREAYRATKVYEYYTSQSYAAQEKLFLVRMVARGDYNLENYLTELRNAFNEFEEEFGNPDTRVHVVSVRDDVLRIPRSSDAAGQAGVALSQAERIELLRQELRNTKYLDGDGYISLPFGTALDQTSPITRNHKVLFVEAEFIGSDVGDPVGRLYLTQEGTGVVRTVENSKNYYRLPERVAVLNPLFNGTRVYSPEVYRNYRMRDRPLVNTAWRLVINQRDESVNQDVNLQSLTDIKLYVYYTDFTRL